MAKINQLDTQILKILLRDGRTGYCEMAQLCAVSKNKVWKRCKALEKKGIITGATVQINFGHFGFDALATLLISVESQQLDQVMQLIDNVTEVRAYRQYNSVFNIRAFATLRNLNELDHIKQLIKRKLPMISLKTYIWTAVRNIPENLNLLDKYAGQEPGNSITPDLNLSGKSSERIAIDDLDKQIVGKLTGDGRSSFSRIAREIGLSTDTVVKRYRRLKENSVLRVSVQMNLNKLGYSSILDFNIAFTTPGGLSTPIVESLARIPDIIIITKTSGDYDLQVTAMVKDMQQSFDIQDQIARICGVTKMEVSARKIPDRWPTPQQFMSTF